MLTAPTHNDPTNLVDPTGLLPKDCNLNSEADGRCVYVVNDLQAPIGDATYKSGGAVGQNWEDINLCGGPGDWIPYCANNYSYDIYARSLQVGFDTRLVRAAFDVETSGFKSKIQSSAADYLLCNGGRLCHPGPTNMSWNALAVATTVDPHLLDRFGGDMDSGFQALTGMTAGNVNGYIARSTAATLKAINIILQRVIDRTGAQRIEPGQHIPDDSGSQVFYYTSLVYMGYNLSGNASGIEGRFDVAVSDTYLDRANDDLLRGRGHIGDYRSVNSTLYQTRHGNFVQGAYDYYCGTAVSQGGASRYVC